MWADQISSTDGVSIAGDSLKKERSQVSLKREASAKGYDAAPTDRVSNESTSGLVEQAEAAAEGVIASAEAIDEESKAAEGPSTEVQEEKEDTRSKGVSSNQAPIAFPSSPVEEFAPQIHNSPKAFPKSVEDDSTAPSAPIAFPIESPREASPALVASPPAVTFGESAMSPPKSGTPDPDSEPKRKRISSQNFQRLARKLSTAGRRQNSVSSLIPDILRRDSSPRVSTDNGGVEGSSNAGAVSESPAGSVKSDENKSKNLKKKSKKRKDNGSV